MSNFDHDELGIIEEVIHDLGYESAAHLETLSHREIGWRVVEMGERIPYNTVFSMQGSSRRGISVGARN
jgi:uncharacterized phage-associated protein